jgi:hypothetical protein
VVYAWAASGGICAANSVAKQRRNATKQASLSLGFISTLFTQKLLLSIPQGRF